MKTKYDTNIKRHSLKRLKNDLEFCLIIGVYLIFSILILGISSLEIWLLDLLSHFRIQFVIISGIGLIVFVFKRKRIPFTVSLGNIIINTLIVLPYFAATTLNKVNHEVKSEKVRFMISNIFSSNIHFDEAIELFIKTKPDFLVILELNEIWNKKLDALKDSFPYEIRLPRNDNFGIALFSKYPLEDAQISPLLDGMTPAVITKSNVNGHQINILGVHTLPPISSSYFNKRNQQLRLLGEHASKSEIPLVLLGDLNTTMWTSSFIKFLKISNLKDTRLAQGINPTWPTQLYFLQIPIDQILVSSEWEVLNLHSVNLAGSDHQSLVLDANLTDQNSRVRK